MGGVDKLKFLYTDVSAASSSAITHNFYISMKVDFAIIHVEVDLRNVQYLVSNGDQ